jgi:dimethylhistidine N-methyltransferase
VKTISCAERFDLHDAQEFLHDVLAGLAETPKTLPCKYFYDERGSQLFDRICRLDEYYLTQAELQIMRSSASAMAEQIGPGALLVEYGSGSSLKTRLLLDALKAPAAYVPVDISAEHLRKTARRLSEAYPAIEILPLCADFTRRVQLPNSGRPGMRTVVYFPGSTIGNFEHDTARTLLRQIAQLCGAGGCLLIGVDLKKDIGTIEAAYNDALGVSDEFNLNLLRRINRELGGDFRLEQFRHHAEYNTAWDRVEMFLVSRCRQCVTIAGESFEFVEGEPICTEHSHKYSPDKFADLAASAGFRRHKVWTDDEWRFAVMLFDVEA